MARIQHTDREWQMLRIETGSESRCWISKVKKLGLCSKGNEETTDDILEGNYMIRYAF